MEDLIDALKKKWGDIEATGKKDGDEVNDEYEKNLFDTWASLQFDLDSDQKSSGKLVTSQTEPSKVKYTILINPSNWGQSLSSSNYVDTGSIYNDEGCSADLFWSTGYLTLQNFVGGYLAQQYDNVSSSFEASALTYLPTYPPTYQPTHSPTYLCRYVHVHAS